MKLFHHGISPKGETSGEEVYPDYMLRHKPYVAENSENWEIFTDAHIYVYNTPIHTSTGLIPFDLVLKWKN